MLIPNLIFLREKSLVQIVSLIFKKVWLFLLKLAKYENLKT